MPFKRGNKLGGRRSTRTSNVARTPTPQIQDDGSDEEMVDGDTGDARDGTPQEEVEEDAATPAQEDDDEAESPPTITTIPRRRRGRGAIRQSSRMDTGTPEPGGDDISESGTPYRRRRGRPAGPGRPPGSASGRGRGGFRGRRKGAQPEAPRVVDRDGTVLDVVDDDAVVDDDPEGNEKVDSLGNLQGGREYRVRTFTLAGRGERLYMLSTEPARCCGFRDSYLFFTKHPKLYKVVVNEEEKKDLIERDILPNSYKGRNIGVVTARSVFREFGARIIVGGRKVIDDYKVAEARANGEVEGELADPDDRIPDNKDDYNRNRYVAWFGASEVYRNTGGANAGKEGKPGQIGKRRNNVTVTNWQFVHARQASRFNSSMTALRHANLGGVYDTATNMMFYPKIMQPTHARWEQIPPPESPAQAEQKQLTNGLPNGHLTNGTSSHDDGMDTDQPQAESSEPTIFTPVPPVVSRNFTVIDTHFISPPLHSTGYPGPDGYIEDPASGPNGLSSVPDDIVDKLPEDCRRAFQQARETERSWKKGWGTEVQSGLRGALKVGLNGYPV
ncbi:chromatin structure-remodeling complex subunit RSC7 [Vermiconidia calcicola]|uniref:Chromatin structure-remodeling complex subunit RSC7 n=1 Tax=Vermiconidia calcicola TaxID=1690605 RepID=A0ACC3N9L6_9PEZI|nr:chromatin structure-remodeling complex subunit RSC7 [Vermiconidia calcicola]